MSTGDLKNNVKQLLHELKTVKYGKSLDIDLVKSGSPQAYLPIYHFLFTSYKTKLNADIVNSNNELYGKSDMRFMEAVYKILRDIFGFKPKITRDQFFAPGFSEQKVIMATDIVRAVKKQYSPPKSSKFHVAPPRLESGASAVPENVVQEPVEMPRKVSGKHITANVVGAIVLPSKVTSECGGYKIPKGGHSAGLKHGQERPVFERPVPAASSASSSSVRSQRHRPGDAVEPVVIRAFEEPGTERPSTASTGGRQHQVPSERDDIEGAVRRKIVELVSPAMVKMNERLGMLEINLSDVENREKQTEKTEPPASAALLTGLSQQMSDVVFKLQTLTSRVTLLENRVTMVEAQLNDEQQLRMTMSASQNYLKSKKDATNAAKVDTKPQNSPLSFENSTTKSQFRTLPSNKMAQAGKLTGNTQVEVISTNLERAEQEKKHDGGANVVENGEVEFNHSEGQTAQFGHEDDDIGNSKGKGISTAAPSLAFMKTLVNPEDCGSLLTTSETDAPEDLTVTETENTMAQTGTKAEEEEEKSLPLHKPTATTSSELTKNSPRQSQQQCEEDHFHQQQKGSKSSKSQSVVSSALPPQNPLKHFTATATSSVPFSQDFSPIRPFSSDLSFLGGTQDESASLVFQNSSSGLVRDYDGDESSLAARRSSTPTGSGEGLDLSTLDRISRINQMMAATEQLLPGFAQQS